MIEAPFGSPAWEKRVLADVEAIEKAGIEEAFAFTARIFTKVTFPHSYRSAESGKLTLHNGNMTVTMTNTDGGGLPYGHYARLIMFWLTREASQRHNDENIADIDTARVIPLGDSAHRVLREMGVLKPGQRACRNHYAALTEQMERLADTTISTRYDMSSDSGCGHRKEKTHVADESYFWWQTDNPSGNLGSGSYITLSREFFLELATHAVPLNSLHVAKIYRSPLALDLYSWAAHRIHTHNGDTRVTWQQIKGQIGTNYPETHQGLRDFKKKTRIAIARIADAWPESGISEWNGGVRLTGHVTPVHPKITPPPAEPRF